MLGEDLSRHSKKHWISGWKIVLGSKELGEFNQNLACASTHFIDIEAILKEKYKPHQQADHGMYPAVLRCLPLVSIIVSES